MADLLWYGGLTGMAVSLLVLLILLPVFRKKVLYQPCRYRLIQHLSISYMVSTRARTTAISARVIRVRGESIPPEVPLMTP